MRSIARLLRLVVAISLLYYIFSLIDLHTFIEAISDLNLLLICTAFVFAILVQLIVSYRLKYLTDVQNLKLSTPLVFEVNLATRFYALFLPAGNLAALLIRIFKLTRDRSQIASIIVSLFADRIMATLALCILGLLFWVITNPPPDKLWLITFTMATVASLALAYIFFIPRKSRQPGLIAQLVQRIIPYYSESISDIFYRSRQSGNKILTCSLAISIAAHLVGTVSYWLIAQSLNMELSLAAIAWIRSGMVLATLLPITIAGIGVREVTALILLQPYGIEADITVAFSMLIFIITIVGIGLLGGLTEAWRFIYSTDGQSSA